jgi:hypothetical protein
MGRVHFRDEEVIIDASFGAEMAVLSNGSAMARKKINESTEISPKTKRLLQQSPVIIPDTRQEINLRLYAMIEEVGQGIFEAIVIDKKFHPLNAEDFREALLKYYDAFDDVANDQDKSDECEGIVSMFYTAGKTIAVMVASVLPEELGEDMPDKQEIDDAFFNGSTAMLLYQALVNKKRNKKN